MTAIVGVTDVEYCLLQALVAASQYPDLAAQEALGTNLDEDAAVFFLELLLRIVLQNRYTLPHYLLFVYDMVKMNL